MSDYGKHTKNPGWQPGNHWVVCDRCGFDYRVKDVALEWTGSVVCKRWCYEPRHPQDLLRGFEDDQTAKGLVRTEPDDVFIQVDYLETGESAVAGQAIAGIAIAGSSASGFNFDNKIPEGTFSGSPL